MLSENNFHTLEPADASARAHPAEAENTRIQKRADDDSVGNALLTGLLVMYPAVATLAVIVAGMFFSGANGGL